MRKALAFAAILMGAWAVSPRLAVAFQEVPVSPPEQKLSIPGQGAARDGVTFETPASSAAPKTEKGKGTGLGSLNVLPKLDFGLELLYGNNAKDDATLNAPAEPSSSSDDVQILGTVKRRF